MDEVVPTGRAFRNAKAYGEQITALHPALHFLVRQVCRFPVEPEGLATRLGLGAKPVDFLGRREVAIGMSRREQSLGVDLVPLDVRPLVRDFLVPGQAEPLESLENGPRAFLCAARTIGVLDAEQELAPVTTDVEPVEERGSRATDVEIASRRRCKTESIRQLLDGGRGTGDGNRCSKHQSPVSRPPSCLADRKSVV